VGHQNEPAAAREHALDRRERHADAAVIGDLPIFERDVEVHAHENAPTPNLNLIDATLGHGTLLNLCSGPGARGPVGVGPLGSESRLLKSTSPMLQRFPVIVGPTAGGKSALAVALAQRLAEAGLPPGEVVTADSMQVYRGMDIGTAKPTLAERAGIPHHLIDIAEPNQPFSVDQWLGVAEPLIDEIRQRGRTPIVVGGTHFYVKALIEGLFDGPGADEALRERLAALPREELRARLERADPAAAARIHANDTRRTVRALEVFELTGTPISQHQKQWDSGQVRPDVQLIGLEWETEALNRRINARVRLMIEQGLVAEARGLWSGGLLGTQAREALGYKQLIEHFEGRCDLDEAVERIKIETRRFAKNQRTWLKRLRMVPGALWIPGGGSWPLDQIQSLIK
jgi:tRNA dimethylallyltransferase